MVRSYLYVISNTQATFGAQYIKKLRNTEAELKKGIAYKRSVQFVNSYTMDPTKGLFKASF